MKFAGCLNKVIKEYFRCYKDQNRSIHQFSEPWAKLCDRQLLSSDLIPSNSVHFLCTVFPNTELEAYEAVSPRKTYALIIYLGRSLAVHTRTAEISGLFSK